MPSRKFSFRKDPENICQTCSTLSPIMGSEVHIVTYTNRGKCNRLEISYSKVIGDHFPINPLFQSFRFPKPRLQTFQNPIYHLPMAINHNISNFCSTFPQIPNSQTTRHQSPSHKQCVCESIFLSHNASLHRLSLLGEKPFIASPIPILFIHPLFTSHLGT